MRRISAPLIAALAPILTAWAVLGGPSIVYPFGFDQANQALAASAILEGARPFSEVPSLKPPLALAFHALGLSVFGHTMVAVRALDLLWTLATALVIASCIRKAWTGSNQVGSLAAGMTGSVYLALYYSFDFWHIAQADGWMNLPIAIATRLALGLDTGDRIQAQLRRQFFIGLCVGAALLFKYTAVGLALLFLLFSIRKKGGSSAQMAAFGLGALNAAVLLLVLLAAWGSLGDFFNDHLSTVIAYSQTAEVGQSDVPLFIKLLTRLLAFSALTELTTYGPPIFALCLSFAVVLGGLLALNRWRWRIDAKVPWILGWLLAAWFSVAIQGRFFGYHFLPMLLPMSIGTGVLAGLILEKLQGSTLQRIVAILIGVLLLALAIAPLKPLSPPYVSFNSRLHLAVQLLSEETTLRDLWRGGSFDTAPNYVVSETTYVADAIEKRTGPDDTLFVWGSNRGIYFLTQRPRVSLILNSYEAVPTGIVVGRENGAGELLQDLRRTPPVLVLVQSGDQTRHLGMARDSRQLLLQAPEILSFFQANYASEGAVGRFEFLRLKEVVP